MIDLSEKIEPFGLMTLRTNDPSDMWADPDISNLKKREVETLYLSWDEGLIFGSISENTYIRYLFREINLYDVVLRKKFFSRVKID